MSKRNTVRLINNIVEKTLDTPAKARQEANTLNALYASGVQVPRVLGIDGNILQLEYIKGKTLPDLIDEWEGGIPSDNCIDKTAEAIVLWLVSFYDGVDTKATGIIRGDINGRNFIICNSQVWGVDFEEETTGDILEDAGMLMAFTSTYDPADTPVKTLLADRVGLHFASLLHLDPDHINHHHQKAVKTLLSRRTKNER